MLSNALNSIAREKAILSRNREYIESMDDDDLIEESVLDLDRRLSGDITDAIIGESSDDYDEVIESVIDDISPESDIDEEVDRIVESTENLTIDQIMGIK